MSDDRNRAATLRASLAIVLLLAAEASACSSTHIAPNSNTNWLRSCSSDAACDGEAACLCGVCTQACKQSSECSAAGAGTSCIATSDSRLGTSCDAMPAPVDKICAAPCNDDADCHAMGAALSCKQGVCSASTGARTDADHPALDASIDASMDGQSSDAVCPASCDDPAGTVRTFASAAEVYTAIEGLWLICPVSGQDIEGAPADTIGVEYGPASATGGNMYFLVQGESGPVRGKGFNYQNTYEVAGDPTFQLYMHNASGGGYGGGFAYSPCPRELLVEGGSAQLTKRWILVALEAGHDGGDDGGSDGAPGDSQ